MHQATLAAGNDMTQTTIVYTIDTDGRLSAGLQSLMDNYDIQVNAYTNTELFLNNTTAEQATTCCLLFALDSDCEDGPPLVATIKASRPRLPIIVLCDSPDDSLRDQYIDSGAIDIVSKSMVDAYIFTRLATTLPGAECLPTTQASTMLLPDGTAITIRMIRPDDVEIERQFVIALSDRSRYLRFFSGLRELPDHMLKQLIDPKFPISYALIATISTMEVERQIGVARYAPTETQHVAEFAVVVADEWQGYGIASQLLRGIVTAATVAGLNSLEALVLPENEPMLKLANKFGFVISQESESDSTTIKVMKNLR